MYKFFVVFNYEKDGITHKGCSIFSADDEKKAIERLVWSLNHCGKQFIELIEIRKVVNK